MTYILPETMDASLHGRRMGVGGEITLSRHVKVKAFDSTDEGLSYLVEMDGIRIFHAGDLNNWHWREESTPREIEEAERDFQQVMETMRGEKVDVAFFPVDPRLGMMFDAGPNYFAILGAGGGHPRIRAEKPFAADGDYRHDDTRRHDSA